MRERSEFANIGGKMLQVWKAGINDSLRFEDSASESGGEQAGQS